jgi:predicted transposase/invertase (TIGR01784 family)
LLKKEHCNFFLKIILQNQKLVVHLQKQITMSTKNNTRAVLSFDYAMKKLLRQKSNFKILEGFLTELLGRDILIKSILESESNQDAFDDKQTRIDILAEDVTGELMLVEVQYQFEIDYLHRILYGVSRNIVDFLKSGDKYREIKKVYSISILFFNKFNSDNEYIYHGKTDFRGVHTGKILFLTEQQRKLFEAETASDLYPEYYLLDVTNFDNIAKNTLDEWIYYFKNSEIKETFSAKGMKEVKSHLDFEKLTPEEKRRYEKSIDIKLGLESSIETAKMEGLEEGREEGLAEGIEIGKEEGREEGAKKKETEIILNLANNGFSAEQIAAFTDISVENVRNILKQK